MRTTTQSNWAYILPNGEFYEWGGSIAASTLVATLDTVYHADPTLLHQATPSVSTFVTLTVDQQGDTLTIDPADGYSGSFRVKVSATDGTQTSSQTFNVSVTDQVQAFESIAGQTISHTTDALTIPPVGSGDRVVVNDVSHTVVHGGGGSNSVRTNDSAGNNTTVAASTWSTLYGSSFYNYARSFDRVYAYATAGGTDRAYLYDSSGDDRFVGKATYGRLYGSGFQNFARSFDRVYAYATAGGTDRAFLYDSSGNDRFVGTPAYGSGFYNYARSLGRVYAHATKSESDRALFYDSAGNDGFVARSDSARFYGSGFYNFTNEFERVRAYATRDGSDVNRIGAVDYVLATYGVLAT